MKRRSCLLAVGMVAALSASVMAKPPGGPVNPHGTGKEQTPIEREYHLPPAAETRLTDAVPTLPVKRMAEETWQILLIVLPWMKMI